MPIIDTQFRVTRLPAQPPAQDEYRLPESRSAVIDASPDATGPSAQSPVPHGKAARARGRPLDPAGKHAAPGTGHADSAPPAPEHDASVRITGKVFALRDGSGYAALGSDGHYYRVDGGGHGLAYAHSGDFVDASQVNVARGPVSAVELDAGGKHVSGTGGRSTDSGPALHPPAPPQNAQANAALPDAEHAASQSHATREWIAEHPHTAVRSQANVPPHNAISLLR
ncbi:MAG TPA: hypothetical protein VFQ95_08990 [Rhodanobacteraceae bacterium]|nr:hypothetical protein [Rhodanobacteraceae bacterium]